MSAFLDLFAGIGGFALGAYWAGLRFDEHYYSEVDDYAIRVYQQRFPDAIGLGDITKIDGSKLPYGDWIIAGGFPCQDISVAGKGAGLAGTRSGLWFEMLRLIGDLRPRYAIVENVGALLVRGIDTVLGSLAEIGYDAEWQIISAASVGAPHRRERIWIVAYPGGSRSGRIGGEAGTDSGRRARGNESALRQADGTASADRTHATGATPADVAYPDKTGLQASGTELKTAGYCGCGSDVAYPNSGRRAQCNPTKRSVSEPNENRATLADTDEIMRNGSRGAWDGRVKSTDSSKALADAPNGGNVRRDWELATTQRQVREHRGSAGNGRGEWWATEPDVGRVANGVPSRVDRLKCLGNAIVPQCAEVIFAQSAFDEWREEATR